MEIFFIRHAESENNYLYSSTNSWVGRSEDPWVTLRGEQQAHTLANFLKTTPLGITHIYSSLMVRAAFTASKIAQALNLPHFGWLDLHENGGVYNFDPAYFESNIPEADLPRIGLPGKSSSILETLFPDMILPPEIKDGWWNKPFEEKKDRSVRAARVLSELNSRHGGGNDRVAIISHAGFYNTFIRQILNIPSDLSIWFQLNNCGFSLIDFRLNSTGDRDNPYTETRLVYLNRTDFLAKELLTH